MSVSSSGNTDAYLERGLGLKEATALNMINMVGIGPFIVVPFVVKTMGGPRGNRCMGRRRIARADGRFCLVGARRRDAQGRGQLLLPARILRPCPLGQSYVFSPDMADDVSGPAALSPPALSASPSILHTSCR